MNGFYSFPPLIAHLLELVIVALLLLIATGVGLRLLRVLRVYDVLRLGERVLFGLALGLSAMALLMLAMGLLGVITLISGLIVLVALAGGSFGALRETWPELRGAVGSAWRGLRYPPNSMLAVIILLAVIFGLIKALAPVATQDDLMYHLALAQRYVEAHAIGFYADSTYSGFPQLMEMLYTWGLLLGSDRIAVLLAFSAGMIGPAGAALFARRFLVGERDRVWRVLPLLCAALFLSIPLMGFVLRAANTDPAQASFDFLAIYAFMVFVTQAGEGKAKDGRFAALAGIFAGLSFSTKYYGFAIGLLIVLAFILTWLQKRQSKGPILQGMVAYAVAVICVVAPWLVRDAIATGNPVWPLAGGVFGGSYLSAANPAQSPETLLGSAPGIGLDNLWTGLQFMWQAVTRGPAGIDNQVHEVGLGYLLLPALVLVFFARRNAWLLWVAGFAGGYWLLWAFFFSRTSARYLSTFYLLCAVLAAYGIVSVLDRFKHTAVRDAVLAVVGLLLVWQVGMSGASLGYYLPTVFALDGDAESRYLASYMDDYPMMQFISEKTPEDAVIYVWDGQPRGYRLPGRYVYARLVPLFSGFGLPPDEWRARLGELGIAQVLVHEREQLAPGQAVGEDPLGKAAMAFREKYFGAELFSVGDYALYELKP